MVWGPSCLPIAMCKGAPHGTRMETGPNSTERARGERPSLGPGQHLTQKEQAQNIQCLLSSGETFLWWGISLVCFSLGYLVQVGISPSDSGNNLAERKKGVLIVGSGPPKNSQGKKALEACGRRLLQLDFCSCDKKPSPRWISPGTALASP